MQKTFGLSTETIMWKETWIDLQMKMKDMPYYDYESETEEKIVKGTNDILRQKFSQFIKQPEK